MQRRAANSPFSGSVTSVFNSMRFGENPFTCRCKEGFQISHFYGLFSNDVMAVKRLRAHNQRVDYSGAYNSLARSRKFAENTTPYYICVCVCVCV